MLPTKAFGNGDLISKKLMPDGIGKAITLLPFAVTTIEVGGDKNATGKFI